MKRESNEPPLPTEAELEILNDLWDHSTSTVREVYERLAPGRGIGYTTVLKQMLVMLEKGLVRRNERFRSHLYEAVLTRPAMQARLAADLTERAFKGSAASLVLGALSMQKTSSQELAEIRQLLDQIEKGDSR
jgi:BlaI family penicillinase repressor